MKKYFLLILLLCGCALGTYAKDFSQGQLLLRLSVVKYLSAEGFQPKVDADGDIEFMKNGTKYYVIINENWNEPYIITLFASFGYNDELYTRSNLESCITTVAQYKVVKLFCYDENYSYRSDIFCENVDVFKASFYPMLEQLDKAMNQVSVVLESGLGGVDVVNNKDEVFDRALNAYRNEEYEKAFSLFKILAENRYGKAYGYMGLAYEFGEGVSKDEDLMVQYYNKAVESGYYWCAYRLGYYQYHNKNYSDAMNNFMKCGANENGFQSEAWYMAGKMYELGEGVGQNRGQAISCYKKSVELSSILKCDARLALMAMGETVERKEDFVEATKTMLMGLSPEDMYTMGTEYEYGLNGRHVSLIKAYAYYKAAADEKYTNAECKMGEIFVSKYYPFNDKAKSDKYYSKAIKAYKKRVESDGKACHELGYMYQLGLGVDKNLETAKFYYKSGAMLGEKNAAWRLGVIYKDEMEYTEAYQYLLKAAEGGQGMAMYELAKLYENGLGTPYNKDKAIEWYKKCSESTYSARDDAKEALLRLGTNPDKE